jgi:branched-chain amino acid transport system substrate-binding protein
MAEQTTVRKDAFLRRGRRGRLGTAAALLAAFIVGVAALPVAGGSTPKYPAPSGGNGGATAIGVTAKAVNLALEYSITGPAPGATAGALRGTKAYIDYINSIGGIYGRKLTITPFDDGFDPTKAAANCLQIEPKYFAITGGFGVGDSGCYPSVKSSGIPWVQFWYDSQFETLPNAYFPDTGNALTEPDASDVLLKKLYPKVKKVALLWETTPGNSQEEAHIGVALKKVGFQIVYQQGVNLSLPSFTSYAVAIRNSGAQAVFMDAAEIVGQSRLAQAFTQEDFKPSFAVADTTYASSWHSLAGAGAAGWVEDLPYLPFLSSAALNATPGGKLLAEWFPKANPGQAIDLFAIFGWASTALLVQGMIDAGPHLTRTDVLAAIHKIGSFTAGGLYAPSNIGKKQFSDCTILMESTASGYKQLVPKKAGTFDCDVPGAKIINTPGVPS